VKQLRIPISVLEVLKAKANNHKFHDFDLNNPKEEKTATGITWKRFICKKCGVGYDLGLNQMMELPYSMKIGCRK